MKITISILQKVIVNHFYKLNAGLFMFLFFVLFGLPNDAGGFHIAIAKGIVHSYVFLFVVLAIWFLYNLKCVDYIIKQLKEPQQQFLVCLQNRGFSGCLFYFVYVQFLVLLPVTTYAVFIIIIAFKNSAYTCIAEIIAFITSIILITPLLYVKVLQRTSTGVHISVFKSFSFRINKTISSIPLLHIWHKRKQMLFITKFFSLFFLFLFIDIYEPDYYDIRPLLDCFMLAAICNSAIVFEIRSFENEYLQLYKNFPLPVFKRFVHIIFMYLLLLLPELIFVWKAYPLYFHAADYLQLALFFVSLLSLFHASLLTINTKMDTYIQIVFGICMFLFFVILYNPGIALSLLILLIAYGLYSSYYLDDVT